MKWAVDCDNITLCQHLLEVIDSAAANLLLNLWLKWLVVVVEQLLAVECLQSAENTLTNTANGNSSNSLALQIVLVLGDSCDVPVSRCDLLVGWDEVADEDEDGHDNMLSDRHNVRSGNFCNSDTAVGLVGSVEVDVVRSNTSSDGNLQVLGLSETLGSQVTWVETVK